MAKPKVHTVFWMKQENTFLEYVWENNRDRRGVGYREKIAVFINKKQKIQRMTAQVIWDK